MRIFPMAVLCIVVTGFFANASADRMRELQQEAEETKEATWGHWGTDASKYSSWTNHSNRLIPIYTFGIDLSSYKDDQSVYRDEAGVEALYKRIPDDTVNPDANQMDQTDVYRLQQDAVAAGKKYIILMIFDGMDWQTTRAASIYKTGQVYSSGRGSGLSFQDYTGAPTDFGFFCSSPHNNSGSADVDSQTVPDPGSGALGGYNIALGGAAPWDQPRNEEYLLGRFRRTPHAVTDSASSATSMTSGIKTYNAAINVDENGEQVEPIARQLQAERGFSIGVVTSVPISHATPAAAYANNVNRNDYQDLSRDLVGLPSISHRRDPLPGVDVLLGGGWGENSDADNKQGANFVAGNKYLPESDIESIDHENGGPYVVAQRTPGQKGRDVLMNAARQAYTNDLRLFGFFGVGGGQLPFQTADGGYNPTSTRYSKADVDENPTLADMTRAAIGMLSKNKQGFWLMVEAGDVDWANHSNNLDSSIGAVFSGDAAFRVITAWIEKNDAWDDTALIVTADHGHYFVLDDPDTIADAGEEDLAGQRAAGIAGAARAK